MTDLLYPDFQSKNKKHYTKKTITEESPIDLKSIEAEIAMALWNGPILPVYVAPENDPA